MHRDYHWRAEKDAERQKTTCWWQSTIMRRLEEGVAARTLALNNWETSSISYCHPFPAILVWPPIFLTSLRQMKKKLMMMMMMMKKNEKKKKMMTMMMMMTMTTIMMIPPLNTVSRSHLITSQLMLCPTRNTTTLSLSPIIAPLLIIAPCHWPSLGTYRILRIRFGVNGVS